MLRAIAHPAIPKYLDSFETSDGFCLIQEYKEAPSLAAQKQLSAKQIERIALSILKILVDLQNHTPPIIHRDIKPENILLDRDDRVYLIDFGLARLRDEEVAVSSVAAGTPGFMPPEELFNRRLSEASDLYSLGATLISLLTGTRSVDIGRLLDANYRFNFKHLVAAVDPHFIRWLTKMVEPNVKDRYPNARVALEALTSCHQLTNDSLLTRLALGGILASAIAIIGNMLVPWQPTFTPSAPVRPLTVSIPPTPQNLNGNTERQWFARIKPHCNPVEVLTALRSSPAPTTSLGTGYAAGCYALAGKIDRADELIQALPSAMQSHADGIAFEIGHPVADAGDDESAGPIMQLVLKYQPENYMALYHAGMSEYVLGDREQPKQHLQEFLRIYQNPDGWRQNAREILHRLETQ